MNWLLKMPTQLANIKEVVDAEAVSVDSSYRSTWHEGWQNKKNSKMNQWLYRATRFHVTIPIS